MAAAAVGLGVPVIEKSIALWLRAAVAATAASLLILPKWLN